MDAFEWVKIVSAVLVGNALTGWFAYCAWRVTRNEKMGIAPSRGPVIYLIGMIIPGLVMIAGGLLLRAAV